MLFLISLNKKAEYIPEILSGFGHNVGTQLHDNAASGSAADGHVEEDFRVRHAGGWDVWA